MSYNAPLSPPCLKVSISGVNPVIGIDNRYTCSLSVTPQNIQGGGAQYDVLNIQPNLTINKTINKTNNTSSNMFDLIKMIKK